MSTAHAHVHKNESNLSKPLTKPPSAHPVDGVDEVYLNKKIKVLQLLLCSPQRAGN